MDAWNEWERGESFEGPLSTEAQTVVYEFGVDEKKEFFRNAKAKVNGEVNGYIDPPKNSKPRIQTNTGDLASVTAEAWRAIEQGNNPVTLFRFSGLPARIESGDDGMPMTRPMTNDRMRHRLARDAHW